MINGFQTTVLEERIPTHPWHGLCRLCTSCRCGHSSLNGILDAHILQGAGLADNGDRYGDTHETPQAGTLAELVSSWTQVYDKYYPTRIPTQLSCRATSHMSTTPTTQEGMFDHLLQENSDVLGKYTFEPSVMPGFYSPIFFVPKKDTSKLWLINNMDAFNRYFPERPPWFKRTPLLLHRTMINSADFWISNDLGHLSSYWLLGMTVQKLVLVIKSVYTNEVLERWQFDIECDKTVTADTKKDKSDKAIKEEIRSVIRQITASVTFLPLLETACAFDILVYTDKDMDVPEAWGESGPHFVVNSEEVRLRSFSTSIHKVDAMVAYKKTD